jgi:putative Mg2+ transporter-C (MgtC) family protein
MSWTDFVVRLILAFVLGAAIGVERQWRQTRAVLKTNVLVSLGAAMFVMMASMVPGDASPTRVAAQIVSGIGFLGGGIILRQGASVRGLNTAATLWCAAAVGSLIGFGFLFQAYTGALMVVGANFLLRPIVQQITGRDEASQQAKIRYQCEVVCAETDEMSVRTLIVQLVETNPLISISAMESVFDRNEISDVTGSVVTVKADLVCQKRNDTLIEQLFEQIRTQVQVKSASWNATFEEADF